MKKYLLSLGLMFLSLWALARENPKAQEWLSRNGLTFTENKGQVFDNLGNKRPDILFTAEVNGVSLFFRNNSVSYVFPKVEGTEANGAPEITALYRMDLELVGANPAAKVVSEMAAGGLNNYYLPNNPNGVTDVQSYRKITYKNVYPNIDLVFYATESNLLKYDFVVHPGGKVSDIQLRYTGAQNSELNKSGALEITSPLGKIVEDAPITFQEYNGRKVDVQSNFILKGNLVTFEVGKYDANQTLVIDPLSRQWATFYGSTNLDRAFGVAADNNGRVTITGITQNAAFPVTVGNNMPQTTFGGLNDAFIVQFDANSGARLWSTFYGGAGIDQGLAIASDNADNIYVTGYTTSTNFPLQNAMQTNQAGGGDAFIVKLNANGQRQWATYYGGNGIDQANGIATDINGNVFLGGMTFSTNLPVPGASQANLASTGFRDGFAAKFDTNGALLWGSYYGGTADDQGWAIAVDNSGDVVMTGQTNSSNLPLLNPFQDSNRGGLDAFVVKFRGTTGQRIWSSYYGGGKDEKGNGLSIDPSGNIYLVGYTVSDNLTVINPFQANNASPGLRDGFFVSIAPNGQLTRASYLGGAGNDEANAVYAFATGEVYVSGLTSSTNFPLLGGSFQNFSAGNNDVFVYGLNSNGQPVYSSYYGGSGNDFARAMTGRPGGELYIAGQSSSKNFPVQNAFQSLLNGNGQGSSDDAFVMRFNGAAACAPLNVVPTVTNVACSGQSTGAITLDLSGSAQGPFTFMWTGPNGFNATTQNISGLAAGSYTGRIMYANGCVIQSTFLITQPATPIAVGADIIDVGCFGGTNGAISLAVSGGVLPYSFAWSGPNGFSSSAEDITGLQAGSYTGVITDGAGCVVTANLDVTQPVAIVANIDSQKNVTCHGGNDGAIFVTVDNGMPPYSFSWSGPNGYTSTAEDITDLAPGNYVGIIFDANNCIVAPAPQIMIEEPAPIMAGISTNDPTDFCMGLSATLFASPELGVSYQWFMDGNPIAGAVSNSYTATMAGNYSVQVIDGVGCTAMSMMLPISTLPQPTISISTFDELIFCEGGSATMNATTDAPSWTWLFNGSPVQNGGASFVATLGGEFRVLAVGANGCETLSNILTTLVNPLPVAEVIPPGTVQLCMNDEIQLESVTDIGTNYQWALNGIDIPGANQANYIVSGIGAPGMYNYTVRISNNVTGCVRTSLATIINLNMRPTVSLNQSGAVTYCSNAVVAIEATITGADKIEWFRDDVLVAEDVATFSPTESGIYHVVVTDMASGCAEHSQTVDVTINAAPNTMVDNAGPVVTCLNSLVTLTASGGDIYQWFMNGDPIDGATDATYTPDASGMYSVLATFTASGCAQESMPVDVTVNPLLIANAGVDVIICEGDIVSLGDNPTASGGDGGPYTYSWAPVASLDDASASNPVASPAVPTTYTLTVTDGTGNCMVQDQVIVFANPQPKPVVTANGLLQLCQDGTVDLNTNLVGASYQWYRNDVAIDGATNPAYTVTMVGDAPDFTDDYYVVVTGFNGCEGPSNVISVTVFPNPDVTLTLSGPTTFCQGGSVTFEAPAVTPDPLTNLIYQWFKDGNIIDGATDVSYTATENGAYFVNIKNTITGCEENSATENVVVNPLPVADAGDDFALCANGVMMLGGTNAGSAGTAPYSYSWEPTMGIDDPTLANPMLTQLANGTVVYTLTVTDANGCMDDDDVIVILKPDPVVSISADFNRTKICEDGFIKLNANVAPIPSYMIVEYVWMKNGDVVAQGPDNFLIIDDLVSDVDANYEATMSVMAVSSDGCKGTSSNFEVTVFPNPDTTITLLGNTRSCFGATDLTIEVPLPASASPLDAFLIYTWYRNGVPFKAGDATVAGITMHTLPTNEPIGMHNYFVNIKNVVTGCEENTNTVFVTVYPNPVAHAGASKITCQGDAITLDGSASGGSSEPYMYMWSPAANLDDATLAMPTFVSDVAGVYPYSLVVSQDNNGVVCSSVASSIDVTVHEKPVVAIALQSPQDKLTFCLGGFVTMVASNTNPNVTVAGYQWYKDGTPIAGATADVFSTNPADGLSAQGEYVAEIITTDGCKNQSAIQTVQISEVPVAEITYATPAPHCEGLANELSAANAANDASIMIYEWRLNSLPLALNTGVPGDNVSIIASVPGNYEVLVTNSITFCASLSGPIVIHANPVANAGADMIICPDKATMPTMVNGSASGGDGNYTYSWSGDVNALAYLSATDVAMPTFQQAAYTPGVYTYTLTVTDGNGCISATDDVIVTVSDLMTVSVVPGQPTGCGFSDGSLMINVSGGVSPYTYMVFNGQNLMYPAVTVADPSYNYTGFPADMYNVKVVDGAGCEVMFATATSLTVFAPIMDTLATTTSRIDLTWTNVSGATYQVRYRIEGADNGNWTEFSFANGVTIAGSGVVPSRRFGGLQNNTNYEFEITASCPTGEVSPVSVDTFPTQVIAGTCPRLGGVFVNLDAYEAVNDFTTADVHWNLDGDATFFDVEYRLEGIGAPWTRAVSCLPATPSAIPGTAMFTLNSLFENSIYEVRVRKHCGPCDDSGQFSVVVTFETGGNCSALPLTFDAIASSPTACSDAGINLTTNLPSGLQPNIFYQWVRSTDINGPYTDAQGTSNQPTYTATEPGTFFYRVDVTVGTCAPVSSNPVLITVFEQPQVIAQVDQPLSCAASTDASIIAGCLPFGQCNPNDFEFSIDGITYQPNGFGGQFNGLAAGDYTVFIRNISTGCVGTFPISITFTPPVEITGVDLIGSNRARAIWSPSSNAIRYQIRWRIIGSGDDGWSPARDADEDATNGSLDGPTVALASATSESIPAATGPANKGLRPDGQYEVQLRVMCAGNVFSAWSLPFPFSTNAIQANCGDVGSLYVDRDVNSAVVNWTEPSLSNNAPICYQVQYRQTGSTVPFTTLSTSNTQIQIDGLLAGTQYDVRVRAICTGTCASPGITSAFNTTRFTTLLVKDGAQQVLSQEDPMLFSVYPNPNRGNFTVSFNATENTTASIRLTDMTGRVVFEKTFDVKEGKFELPVEVTNYAAGVYLLHFQQGDNVRTTKLVLN